MRRVLPAMLVLALVGCAAPIYRPPGRPAPSAGEPQLGVPYRVTHWCDVTPVQIGDSLWQFQLDGANRWPPDEPPKTPFGIWDEVGSSYAVNGIVTVLSERTAIFRADVDGAELPLLRVTAKDVEGQPTCY